MSLRKRRMPCNTRVFLSVVGYRDWAYRLLPRRVSRVQHSEGSGARQEPPVKNRDKISVVRC
jgi:hypothetical protein